MDMKVMTAVFDDSGLLNLQSSQTLHYAHSTWVSMPIYGDLLAKENCLHPLL
jgi:hypothetical protein